MVAPEMINSSNWIQLQISLKINFSQKIVFVSLYLTILNEKTKQNIVQ